MQLHIFHYVCYCSVKRHHWLSECQILPLIGYDNLIPKQWMCLVSHNFIQQRFTKTNITWLYMFLVDKVMVMWSKRQIYVVLGDLYFKQTQRTCCIWARGAGFGATVFSCHLSFPFKIKAEMLQEKSFSMYNIVYMVCPPPPQVSWLMVSCTLPWRRKRSRQRLETWAALTSVERCTSTSWWRTLKMESGLFRWNHTCFTRSPVWMFRTTSTTHQRLKYVFSVCTSNICIRQQSLRVFFFFFENTFKEVSVRLSILNKQT